MADSKTTAIANGQARTTLAQSTVVLPRITIKFCTQCKWNLRAAYYAQELLQTFSTTLGEVALVPSSGGVFEITLFTASPPTSTSTSTSRYDLSTSNLSEAHANAASSHPTSSLFSHSHQDPTSEAGPTPAPAETHSTVPINPSTNADLHVLETTIWNRKTDNGFPETKELKSRVRNVIEPGRDLGHVDRSLQKGKEMKLSQRGEVGEGRTGKATPNEEGPVGGVEKRTTGDVAKEKGVEGEDGKHEEECKDC